MEREENILAKKEGAKERVRERKEGRGWRTAPGKEENDERRNTREEEPKG